MAKKDDKKGAGKQPAKAEPAKPAAVAPKAAAPKATPVGDPKRAVAAVLDVEIAHLKSQLATMEKQGASEAQIEQVRNRLRLRAIQRVKLG